MTHLEDRLNETGMNQFVNVVVMSDHGMTFGHHAPYEVERKVEIRKVKLSNHLVEGTYRYEGHCKFYLARWSHGVALFLSYPNHQPTHPTYG